MVFVILKNNIIYTICNNIDNVYNNILTYVRIILEYNNNINFFDNLNIIEYNDGYPVNTYRIDKQLNLFDQNNKIINIVNLTILNIKDNILKLLNENIESDLFIHLPSNIINNISEHNIYIKSNNNIDFIKKEIELNKEKLEKINNNYENKLNNYLQHKHKLGLLQEELKIKKEKENENFRKFQVANQTYDIIIDEINNNIRDSTDIPELFKYEFNLLKIINNEYNNLSEKEKYNKYIEIKNSILPTNTNIVSDYDNMFLENPIYKDNCLSNNSNDSDDDDDD